MEQGDALPELRLPDENGETRTFDDLTGEEGLILYVYPRDMTPGCTTEATDFRDHLQTFHDAGWAVAGVSRDGAESHCKFRDKHGLTFPLLTDESGEYLRAIDAYGEKKLYGKVREGVIRSTLAIGRDGTVRHAFHNVRAKGHVERLIRDLGLA